MFRLTKFSGEELWINPELIKFLEKGGDTIVTLTSGEKILVKESVEEIRKRFMDYKKSLFSNIP